MALKTTNKNRKKQKRIVKDVEVPKLVYITAAIIFLISVIIII